MVSGNSVHQMRQEMTAVLPPPLLFAEEDPLVQKPESASNPKPDPDSGSKRESEKPAMEPMDTESKEKVCSCS